MRLDSPANETEDPLPEPNPLETMAKSQIKAGGPTRGRRRVHKIGMGSGKFLADRRAKKGK